MTRIARLDENSKFQIDLALWEQMGRDFRAELLEALCQECRAEHDGDETRMVDRVDPATGEVTKFDAAWECLMSVCASNPAFIPTQMVTTRAIFRAFLAEGNRPMSAAEIHQRVRKSDAKGIFRELIGRSGDEYGIVPVDERD